MMVTEFSELKALNPNACPMSDNWRSVSMVNNAERENGIV
jgi:hypothetical protein